VIPFLILALIFLVSGATKKTRTDVRLVIFIIVTLLTKPGPMQNLWNSLRISFSACKPME
jgi:ABC-type uncharacterized transport system permease subunit